MASALKAYCGAMDAGAGSSTTRRCSRYFVTIGPATMHSQDGQRKPAPREQAIDTDRHEPVVLVLALRKAFGGKATPSQALRLFGLTLIRSAGCSWITAVIRISAIPASSFIWLRLPPWRVFTQITGMSTAVLIDSLRQLKSGVRSGSHPWQVTPTR